MEDVDEHQFKHAELKLLPKLLDLVKTEKHLYETL